MANLPGKQKRSGEQCWAHLKNGERCSNKVKAREGEDEDKPIPYCMVHLRSGDQALRVVNHPTKGFGKLLIARKKLPKGYRMVYWGSRTRCPYSDQEDRCLALMLRNSKNNEEYQHGVINPDGHDGSVLQFACCPGPSEVVNMRGTENYFGKWKGTLAGREYVTLTEIEAGVQLAHWYGNGWWPERGIKREDMGTKRYPMPLRARSRAKSAALGAKKSAGSAPPPEDALHLYSTVQYWEKRYGQEGAKDGFEWYADYDCLREMLEECIGKEESVLELGCGNSALAVDMHKDGYKRITAIDFSAAVIDDLNMQLKSGSFSQGAGKGTGKGKKVKGKHKASNAESGSSSGSSRKRKRSGADGDGADGGEWVRFEHMDARELSYPAQSFAHVLDKATLDAILCDEGEGIANALKVVAEVDRVLRPGGSFVLISHFDPQGEFGMDWFLNGVIPALDRVEHEWNVVVHSMEDEERMPHIYVMTKNARKGKEGEEGSSMVEIEHVLH